MNAKACEFRLGRSRSARCIRGLSRGSAAPNPNRPGARASVIGTRRPLTLPFHPDREPEPEPEPKAELNSEPNSNSQHKHKFNH